MNSLKKKVINSLCLLIFFNLFISNISASTPTPVFGGKYSRGVSRVSAYIHTDSKSQYWTSFITTASNNWMYTGWDNPIYVVYASSNVGTMMDIYAKNDSFWPISGVLGETRHYTSTGVRMSPVNGNWYYADIFINDYEFRKTSFTNENAIGTIIHEMGHAFGLAHNNSNSRSIMAQSWARVVQRVQKTDNDAINHLY